MCYSKLTLRRCWAADIDNKMFLVLGANTFSYSHIQNICLSPYLFIFIKQATELGHDNLSSPKTDIAVQLACPMNIHLIFLYVRWEITFYPHQKNSVKDVKISFISIYGTFGFRSYTSLFYLMKEKIFNYRLRHLFYLEIRVFPTILFQIQYAKG